jgi:hypothetical protein
MPALAKQRAFARNLKTVAIRPWNFASGWARADDRHGQARGPPGRHDLSQLRLPVCRRRPSTPVPVAGRGCGRGAPWHCDPSPRAPARARAWRAREGGGEWPPAYAAGRRLQAASQPAGWRQALACSVSQAGRACTPGCRSHIACGMCTQRALTAVWLLRERNVATLRCRPLAHRCWCCATRRCKRSQAAGRRVTSTGAGAAADLSG